MKGNNSFDSRDYITSAELAERMGICRSHGSTKMQDFKRILHAKGRDLANVNGRISKADYAYIVGIDVSILYSTGGSEQ